MSDVLFRIAQDVRKRLEERLAFRNAKSFYAQAMQDRSFRSLKEVLQKESPQILAEVKLASPSEGNLAAELDPVQVAGDYLKQNAAALSVLTEQDHFGGSPAFLQNIRNAFPQACLLMKDFVIEEEQLLEARAWGADAVLLIVALLGPSRCRELYRKAKQMGLSVLVEVHDAEELKSAAALEAEVIGVNNRNLKTMQVSLDVSRRLIQEAPKGSVMISESGLTTSTEILELYDRGYSAFLMGTHFMKTKNPGQALELLQRQLQRQFQ